MIEGESFVLLKQLRSGLVSQLNPLRSRILNDPYYRLQSLAEVEVAANLGVKIDVNQATVDDWLRLPGLSIHQARSLAALTQAGVQFYGLEDLAAALNLPPQQLQSFQPILQFCYYDAESPHQIQPINPNYASIEQLNRLPGVDLYLARAIVQQRKKAGVYRNLADLQQRLTLPATLTAKLLHYLCF